MYPEDMYLKLKNYWDYEVNLMKKELFYRIVIGVLSGIVICYCITIGISIALGNGVFYPCVPSLINHYGSELNAVIIQTILSVILGAGFAGASVIWEKDEWSLLKQTGIYFAIVTVIMMTVAYVCEWMEHSVKGVASYFTVFFAIFIVVWLVRYIGWKIYISKIKEKITKQI
jgi:hypothetical protein